MEVVVSFPLGYMVNVIGQDLLRPNEEWKENSQKRFFVKGCCPHRRRHLYILLHRNETIQSQEQAYHEEVDVKVVSARSSN